MGRAAQAARDADRTVQFTLPGAVVDELVDWRNFRGRAAVATGPVRPVLRGTQVAVTMRVDDARDLARYLEQLIAAVEDLPPADRRIDSVRYVDMRPCRRVAARLAALVEPGR